MLIFLSAVIFVIALVILIVYAVRLSSARKKYLSDEALQKVAEKSVQNARMHDRFITCDYCGARIDTQVDKVCPQCGGAFGRDEEWKNRHAVDEGKARRHAKTQYSRNLEKTAQESGQAKNRIRNILILALLILVVGVSAAVAAVMIKEKLALASDKIPEGYSKCEYSFNDAVLLDDAGVSVVLGDIYEKDFGEDSKSYAVELITNNSTDNTIYITTRVGAINKKVYNILLSNSPIVSGDVPIIRYLIFKNTQEPELKEAGFIDMIAAKDGFIPIAGMTQGMNVESGALYEPEKPELIGETLFEEPVCRITLEKRSKLYDDILCIENTGEKAFTLKTSGVLDGKDTHIYLHDTVLPGTVGKYRLSDIFPTNSLLSAEKVQIRIKGQDVFASDIFDTGYISLN